VSISGDDPPIVAAVATGEATVTATKAGLSAATTITVAAGTAFPDGTNQWSLAPVSEQAFETVVYMHAIDDDGPVLAAVEAGAIVGEKTIRAVDRDGQGRWVETVPGRPVMGAWSGGFITAVSDEWGDDVALAHVGVASPWRYSSAGYVGAPAMAPDGTLFAGESLPGVSESGVIWDRAVVVIDAASGHVRRRVQVPRDTFRNTATSTCSESVSEQQPWISDPVVGHDGRAYVQVRQLARVNTRAEGYACDQMSKSVDYRLELWTIAADGAVTSELIYRFQKAGNQYECDWIPLPGDTLPDSAHGVLATWARYTCGESESKISRFAAVDGWNARDFPPNTSILLTGESATAYLMPQTGETVTAVDVQAWVPRWTFATLGSPVKALRGGGLAIHDQHSGNLQLVNGMGQLDGATTLNLTNVSATSSLGSFYGLTGDNNQIAKIKSLDRTGAIAEFANRMGDKQGTRSMWSVYLDNTAGTQPVLVKGEDPNDVFQLPAASGSLSELRRPIDGVKPDGWRSANTPMFSGDWYKLIEGIGVVMNTANEPAYRVPVGWESAGTILVPECHYWDISCNWNTWLYEHFGGRKLEPDWSNVRFTDWLPNQK